MLLKLLSSRPFYTNNHGRRLTQENSSAHVWEDVESGLRSPSGVRGLALRRHRATCKSLAWWVVAAFACLTNTHNKMHT